MPKMPGNVRERHYSLMQEYYSANSLAQKEKIMTQINFIWQNATPEQSLQIENDVKLFYKVSHGPRA